LAEVTNSRSMTGTIVGYIGADATPVQPSCSRLLAYCSVHFPNQHAHTCPTWAPSRLVPVAQVGSLYTVFCLLKVLNLYCLTAVTH